LRHIVTRFRVDGDVGDIVPFGNGHIHDTFAVTLRTPGGSRREVLQRVNHHVFRDVPAVQRNIELVTAHVRAKLSGAADLERRVLTFHQTHQGGTFHRDEDGNFWRLCPLLEGTVSHDNLSGPEQAEEVARAFGEFQLLLADLDAGQLAETIPFFHDGPRRLAAFRAAREADVKGRVAGAGPEIAFVEDRADVYRVLADEVAAGRIPVRITHNDTKVNNVLMDEATGRAVCVIDLDTVMPGLAVYDFGDMVRTGANSGDEDDRDLNRVSLDEARFEAMLRGYLASAGGFLNAAEREHLVFACRYFALLIGTRFLTDHLAGDTYFRIHREDHNLQRARAQFKLAASIEARETALRALVG
jgi:Ser/Thr protein kinase RdoA (MazF antagonist)